MEKGAAGENVRILQQRLIDLGFLTNDIADGKYGGNTEAAVKKVQKVVGLPETGTADQLTQAYIFGDIVPE